jgi:ABC-type transporter Mla subunit MlaD
MAPPSLRSQLARLEQPVEIDAVASEVAAAQRAVQQYRDGLRGGIQAALLELAEAAADVGSRSEQVAKIDARTSRGILGALLSSADDEGVEETRARAASSLSGSLAVLDHRIESTRAWGERVAGLASDARYGQKALEALGERALGGGLDAELVDGISRAAAAVGAVPGQIRGLAAPLQAPLREASATAARAAAVLKQLRSGVRSASLGEAFRDAVLPGGAVGSAVRGVGGWSDDPDRKPSDPREVQADIAFERAASRDQAREEAEANRAAMAELDELDDW